MRIDAIQYLKEVIEFLTEYKKELEAIEKYNNRLWDKTVGEFQRGRGNPADIYWSRCLGEDPSTKAKYKEYKENLKTLENRDDICQIAKEKLGITKRWWIFSETHDVRKYITALYIIRNRLQFKKPHLPIEKEKDYDRLVEELIVGLGKLGDGRLQEKSSKENIRETKTH